jgi:D-xylose transport system substrate-binding protein
MKSLVRTIAVLALLSGCSKKSESPTKMSVSQTAAAPSGGPKVGFILKTLQEERYKTDKAAFTEFAEKMGATVLFDSCNNDEQTQIAKVETMLTQGVSALVLQPVNHASALTLVDKAHEKGAKLIAYDVMIGDSDVDWFVTQDSLAVGRLQVEELTKKLGKGKKVFLIKGQPGDANAEAFSQGVYEARDKGDIKLLDMKSHEGWAPERAQQTAEDAFTKYGKDGIDAFLCNNSGLAWGVFQTVEARQLGGKVFIAGSDGDLRNVQAIAKGQIAMDVFKAIKPLAFAAALVAVKLAKKEPIDTAALTTFSDPVMQKAGAKLVLTEMDNGKKKVPTVVTPVYAVTKETIDDTVVASGYHAKTAVYGN